MTQLICKDLKDKKKLRDFTSETPMIPTQIEVGHTFKDAKGIAVTDDSNDVAFRWMSLKVVIGIGLMPPSFMLEVEVAAEVDFPSTPGKPPVYAEAKARIRCLITLTYIELEAQIMLKLKTKAQIWPDPFGDFPHMGIVFPLALGFGFRINYFAPPMVTYFEFEAGIMGCSNPLYYKGRLLADIDPNNPAAAAAAAAAAQGAATLGGARRSQSQSHPAALGLEGENPADFSDDAEADGPRRKVRSGYKWDEEVLAEIAADRAAAQDAADHFLSYDRDRGTPEDDVAYHNALSAAKTAQQGNKSSAGLGFFGGGGGGDDSHKKFGYSLSVPGRILVGWLIFHVVILHGVVCYFISWPFTLSSRVSQRERM
jgi:hypothetical protein